jgi:hypothetical protein
MHNLKIKEKGKFDFLKATRFWVMVLGGISIYLETKGFIGEAERNLIATLSASFVTIKTIDKLGE